MTNFSQGETLGILIFNKMFFLYSQFFIFLCVCIGQYSFVLSSNFVGIILVLTKSITVGLFQMKTSLLFFKLFCPILFCCYFLNHETLKLQVRFYLYISTEWNGLLENNVPTRTLSGSEKKCNVELLQNKIRPFFFR